MATTLAFYTDQDINPLSTSHQQIAWNFAAQSLIIRNDEAAGDKTIYWSYNGSSLQGASLPQDIYTLTGSGISTLHIWCDSGGAPAYRVFASPV